MVENGTPLPARPRVRQDQPAADHPNPGVPEPADQLAERAGVDPGVGIGQENEFAVQLGERRVQDRRPESLTAWGISRKK